MICYDGMARGTLGRCSCSWVGAQLARLLAIGSSIVIQNLPHCSLAFPRVSASYFTMCCLTGLSFPSICFEAVQILSENELFGTANVEKARASSEGLAQAVNQGHQGILHMCDSEVHQLNSVCAAMENPCVSMQNLLTL
jgi:hypothetical protein